VIVYLQYDAHLAELSLLLVLIIYKTSILNSLVQRGGKYPPNPQNPIRPFSLRKMWIRIGFSVTCMGRGGLRVVFLKNSGYPPRINLNLITKNISHPFPQFSLTPPSPSTSLYAAPAQPCLASTGAPITRFVSFILSLLYSLFRSLSISYQLM
jgi:hypothetical protein